MSVFSWIDVQQVAGVCEEFGVEELWVEPGGVSIPRASFGPGFVGVEHGREMIEFRAVLAKGAVPTRNVDAPLSAALGALLRREVSVVTDAAGAKSTGGVSSGAIKIYGGAG